jgi:hypothetical protein
MPTACKTWCRQPTRASTTTPAHSMAAPGHGQHRLCVDPQRHLGTSLEFNHVATAGHRGSVQPDGKPHPVPQDASSAAGGGGWAALAGGTVWRPGRVRGSGDGGSAGVGGAAAAAAAGCALDRGAGGGESGIALSGRVVRLPSTPASAQGAARTAGSRGLHEAASGRLRCIGSR